MQNKEIYDPVHGYITLIPLAKSFVDTFEFQRLAFIKQLGASAFIFPSSDHSRKAHSFGCYHLCYKIATKLYQEYSFVTERDVELISVAGLLHDIGHGPFSHIFDRFLQDFPHEERGSQIVRRMVKDYDLPVSTVEVEDIIRMIHPPKNCKQWRYQIVSSTVDADRMDYIVRDSRNVGVVTPFEIHSVHRIIAHMMIVDGQLCFSKKVYRDVQELLGARRALHLKVYQHRVSIAIEEMLLDIFESLEGKWSEKIFDLSFFLGLTDSVLVQVYRDSSVSSATKKLVGRIWSRDLYKVTERDYRERQYPPEGRHYSRWVGMGADGDDPLKMVRFQPPIDEGRKLEFGCWRISTIKT